jgi:hypothetical protein
MGWLFGERAKQKAEAERLHALLKLKIENYKKAGAVYAAQDRYFSEAVRQDTALGLLAEEIELSRQRAIEAEQNGRGFLTAAAALEEVIKIQTKAEMISLMERYVLDFGRRSAELAALVRTASDEQQQERLDTDGMVNSIVMATLNGILAEIKSGH